MTKELFIALVLGSVVLIGIFFGGKYIMNDAKKNDAFRENACNNFSNNSCEYFGCKADFAYGWRAEQSWLMRQQNCLIERGQK